MSLNSVARKEREIIVERVYRCHSVVLGLFWGAYRVPEGARKRLLVEGNWSLRRFDTCDRFSIACHGALAVQRVHFGSRLPERSRFSRYGLIQSYAM